EPDAEGFLGVELANSKASLFIQMPEIMLGAGCAHWKRPVAPEQDPVLADRLDDGLQKHRRVHEAVDIKAAHGLERLEGQVRDSRPLGGRAALPAPAQSRDAPAAVGQNDVEARIALHD